MNEKPIIVFDLETGGLDTQTCEILQIAAIALDPITLEQYSGAEFNQEIQPFDRNNVGAKALEVNKKDLDKLMTMPLLTQVWPRFVDFVQSYNKSKTKSNYQAPIAAGKNIEGFDLPIIERLCHKYGPIDKKNDKQSLFSQREILEFEKILWMWFEGSNELPSYQMDDILPYFGIVSTGAHDALVDVKNTAKLIVRFMKFHRAQASKTKFKDSFCG